MLVLQFISGRTNVYHDGLDKIIFVLDYVQDVYEIIDQSCAVYFA